MSKIDDLLKHYKSHIQIPWRTNAAAAQRVIFCVYNEVDELRFRLKIDEFEIATKEAGHRWAKFDFTDIFAQWLSKEEYVEEFYEKPHLLNDLLADEFIIYINKVFDEFLSKKKPDENMVIALTGIGSLYSIVKIKDVVDEFAPKVSGRLLVFFPGSYEGNNYSLLNAYDGWNYLAVPITADKQF